MKACTVRIFSSEDKLETVASIIGRQQQCPHACTNGLYHHFIAITLCFANLELSHCRADPGSTRIVGCVANSLSEVVMAALQRWRRSFACSRALTSPSSCLRPAPMKLSRCMNVELVIYDCLTDREVLRVKGLCKATSRRPQRLHGGGV